MYWNGSGRNFEITMSFFSFLFAVETVNLCSNSCSNFQHLSRATNIPGEDQSNDLCWTSLMFSTLLNCIWNDNRINVKENDYSCISLFFSITRPLLYRTIQRMCILSGLKIHQYSFYNCNKLFIQLFRTKPRPARSVCATVELRMHWIWFGKVPHSMPSNT